MTVITLDVRDIAREWRELLDDRKDERIAELRDEVEWCHEHGRVPERQLLELESIEEDGFALPVDDEDVQKFIELCNQLSIDPDPDSLEHFGDGYEPTLVHDDSFEEYAEELAEDLGLLPREHQWPLYAIDWERAANDLRVDYTSITYDGDDYLMRSW